jgi:hypothetical protein
MRSTFRVGLASIVAAATMSGCVSIPQNGLNSDMPVSNHEVADHKMSKLYPSSPLSFITKDDASVAAFLEGVKDKTPEGIYNALKEYGLQYALNKYDYAEVTGRIKDPYFDHGVQYPKETLEAKAGDCEDLVFLYCSLLEKAGYKTAMMFVDKHVLMAYDTGVYPDEYKKTNGEHKLAHDLRINLNAWIPVDIAKLNLSDFEDANRSGVRYSDPRPTSELTRGGGSPLAYYGNLFVIPVK